MEPAVVVRGLVKRYGEVIAVRGVDLDVKAGECFGLLGPNGAGKTSIIEILEGLRPRSGGEVRVLGLDPEASGARIRERVGVCLQATRLPDRITVREAVELFASFFPRPVDVGGLLSRLELTGKARSYYQHLSGGQKQRLALALALVNEPEILFLDEPTVGLDPQARRAIHELVKGARAEGRTVLLTTHYIEEAERLCDRVAVVDGGEVIALGSPEELRSKVRGGAVIEIRWAAASGLILRGDEGLEMAPGDRVAVQEDGLGVTVNADRPARSLSALMRWLDQQGVEPTHVELSRPSLEDVFIELTGRSLRDE